MKEIKTVLVTGGAGYVGSILIPKLLAIGYKVKVLDLYIYGDTLHSAESDPNLQQVKGDIRDARLLAEIMPGCDAVIHLACISNDPSFELNPDLGRSINYDAFFGLVDIARDSGVHRFIYASSSSVYGVKKEVAVTEDLPLEPLTDYSKYKALCEDILLQKAAPGFTTFILRPATVCGYSPRLRLDLTVNILTAHAFNNRLIKVFGGSQTRPNIHIEDMTDLYLRSLEWPDDLIAGKIYNAGYENHSVMEIAEQVRQVVGQDIQIATTPTDDNRSYRISSDRIKQDLGFVVSRTIGDAIKDLLRVFDDGLVRDPMENPAYYNIKKMQDLDLR